ncbi:uncharacterized protein LOC120337574 [Styela clava]
MESGEYDGGANEHYPDSWKGMANPPQEIPKSSEIHLPPFYNTVSTAPGQISGKTTYPQEQDIPNPPQGHQAPSGHQFHDSYRYHQHAASPGQIRMMQKPGAHPSPGGWHGNNSPAAQNPPYLSPDRNRYVARAPYPGYDTSKPYIHMGQTAQIPSQQPAPQQGPWPRAPYPSAHPGYEDPSRSSRYGQSDIAGPVVPAGLQALQANNNNATLMQHQHTPMLVPNPHYNQNRAQQVMSSQQSAGVKNTDLQKQDQHTPQRPVSACASQETMYAPLPTNSPMNYYPSHSPHSQQHRNIGPMHHQMGLNSPSVSPYPSNPLTPGPTTKTKTRGNKSYQCPKCVKVFRRGDHLKRHLLSVHDHEHPYQCGECGKGFASVPTLSKHTKSLHIGVLTKGLMCLRCQLTFPTIQEMETHSNSLHIQEDEQYMQNINTSSKQHHCSFCTKSFSSAINLKRHMQLLHRNKDDARVFCRECGKGFSKPETLRKHVDKIHNGNVSAIPPFDETEDPETSSQAHSSESESRGPSADTDESSLSSTPSMLWGGSYPTPPAPQNRGPVNQGMPQPGISSGPSTGLPNPGYHQPLPDQAPPSVPDQNTNPPFLPTQSDQALPNKQPISNSLVKSLTMNDPQQISSNHQTLQTVSIASQQQASTQMIDSTLMQHEITQPNSVSEALSMAMKALSDFDYETGFEMYSSIQPDPPQSNPQVIQQTAANVRHSQSNVSIPRNGISGTINSPKPTDASNNINTYDYPFRGNHFLMTMPPPSASMNAGRLHPQPIMAGSQEAPQLSQLLQEGGGGVRSPIVINNNNNSNTKEIENFVETKKSQRRQRKRRELNNENDFMDYEKSQNDNFQEDKVDLSCNLCNIEYESIDSLMVHIEGVHLKNNPHECSICQKHFAQTGNVKRHIRFVHLKERPFRCNDCSSTFDRLCYLQRHMRTHLQPSDENQEFNPLKPCNCPECGKRCLTAHHLRGHMQRKHFAKNKQNYTQFILKYGHLESIGSGPGALVNSKKGKGRQKKANKFSNSTNVVAFGQSHNIQDTPQKSSVFMPYSSTANSNTLSNVQVQQQYNGLNHTSDIAIQGVCQSSSTPTNLPLQPNFNYYNQQVVSQPNTENTGSIQSFEHESYNANNQMQNIETYFSNMSQPSIENIHIEKSNPDEAQKRNKERKCVKKCLPFRCQHCRLRSFASLAMLRSHMSVVHNAYLKRQVCLSCGLSFHKRAHLKSHMIQAHQSDIAGTKKQKKITSEEKHEKTTVPMLEYAPSPSYPIQLHNLSNPTLTSYYAPNQQIYYGYDPLSPAMVPSPNMQSAYNTNTLQSTTHISLVQT